MKRFLLATALACVSGLATVHARTGMQPLATTPDSTVLWGDVIMANGWSTYSYRYGVYSFNVADNPIKRTSVHTSSYLMQANGGGTWYDGRFHFVRYDGSGDNLRVYYNNYNTKRWLDYTSKTINRKDFIAVCADYDATTGLSYGCYYNAAGNAFEIAKVDYDFMQRTTIAATDTMYLTMSFDATGKLYAISEGGNLYTIDKTTGAATLIGATGVHPSGSLQSAAIDKRTGRMYWAAITSNSKSILYQVDTKTGAATQLSVFPDNEEVTCLYVPDGQYAAETPMAAINVNPHFDGAATTGTVGFRMPTQSVDSVALSGQLNYEVSVNGEVKATATVAPGDSVTVPITAAEGYNVFSVKVWNTAGTAPFVKTQRWLGYDVPEAVSGLSISNDSGKISLSWTAPTKGENDGYIDTANLKYDIVRMPDSVTVSAGQTATTFTETITDEFIKPYSYKVTPINGTQRGESRQSDKVLVGKRYGAPYNEDFSSADGFNTYTVIDANNDGTKWTYNSYAGSARLSYNSRQASDDWLITPSIHLEAGKSYIFTFNVKPGYRNYDERIEASVGKEPTVEGMTTQMVEPTTFNEETSLHHDFIPTETGDYHFGIHGISKADQGGVYVDDISVVEGVSPADTVVIGIPQEPQDVRLTDSVDHLVLTWKAPVEEGAHGGHVYADSLTYNIYKVTEDGSMYYYRKGVTGDSIIINDVNLNDSAQKLIRYAVSAQNFKGEGATAKSTGVVAGKPYTIPFSETFADRHAQHTPWWGDEKGPNAFFVTYTRSYDNDEGSASWTARNTGDEAWWNSGRLSLAGAVSPKLVFYYYLHENREGYIKVEAAVDGNDIVQLDSINAAGHNAEDGWHQSVVDLSPVVNGRYIVLKFHAVATDYPFDTNIDKISIDNMLEHNLGIAWAEEPKDTVAKGVSTDYKVTVTNKGFTTEKAYSVVVTAGDSTVATIAGGNLEPQGSETLTFSYKPSTLDKSKTTALKAEVKPTEGIADLDPTDDKVEKNLSLTESTLNPVTGLEVAGGDNGYTLTWTPPAADSATVTEDFESYDKWSTSATLGNWQNIDGDSLSTYEIYNHKFPGMGDPFGWIVFDADAMGINSKTNPKYAAHGGQQSMASFASRQNDDWLISPYLSGNAQTVSFYARSFNASYQESLEVLTSTAMEPATSDFASVDTISVPATWTKYDYAVPVNTLHFALRNVGKNRMILFLDDVTFQGGLFVSHYNIYRDGQLIGTVDGNTLTFTDDNAPEGIHEYTVTAVYRGYGESGPCNTTTDAITTINSDSRTNGTLYNVAGQRVGKSYCGIVIVNGKKYIQK